ncbi:MAG TPA: polysaccharide biosynthesis/export family protein [Vicinamibacterales bacterium]|nr:polysaccharide biosynthesis/export family protein [Vicinamibacterales bacterium]
MATRIVLIVLALLFSGSASAQTAGDPPTQTPPPAAAAAARPDANAYVVGPDDTLSIVIYGEDALQKEFKVGVDGMISYPYIGDVKVAGLTVRAVEAVVRKRLVDGGILTSPQVVANVTQYRSQVVQVTGQVSTPGDITLQGSEMTLSRALSRAQLTALAGSYVEVRRRKPDADPADMGPDAFFITKVERKDLDSLTIDPQLLDGDRVFVPKAPVFYITGYVKQVGPQVWSPGMTAGKAIAAAGGVSERGTMSRLKILRMVDGEFKEFKADENTPVQPEDQIQVQQKRF